MVVFISHNTALKIWRALGDKAPRANSSRLQLPSSPTPAISPEHVADAVNKAFPISKQAPLEQTLVVEILVSSAQGKKRAAKVKEHVVTASFPPKSFARVNSEIQLCAPELVFLQMASQLSLINLIQLGYELCGTYAIDATSSRGFTSRKRALTTAERITAYLKQCSRIKGLALARRAAQYVQNGSASPMETALAMMLHLPAYMGGYALPPARLNESMFLSYRDAAGQPKERHCRCDLLWPASAGKSASPALAIEYESDAEHLSSRKFSEDSIRRNDLIGANVTVITVTKHELLNLVRWPAIAGHVSKATGKRIRIQIKDHPARQRQLYAQLFGQLFEEPPNCRQAKR